MSTFYTIHSALVSLGEVNENRFGDGILEFRIGIGVGYSDFWSAVALNESEVKIVYRISSKKNINEIVQQYT